MIKQQWTVINDFFAAPRSFSCFEGIINYARFEGRLWGRPQILPEHIQGQATHDFCLKLLQCSDDLLHFKKCSQLPLTLPICAVGCIYMILGAFG